MNTDLYGVTNTGTTDTELIITSYRYQDMNKGSSQTELQTQNY